jgi:hypothetical protein
MHKVLFTLLVVIASISSVNSVSAAFSPSVVVNGLEWLQPSDFDSTFGNWGDVNTVCNSTTGECDGSLGGNDITGWTWANVDEVDALFSAYLTYAFGPGPDSTILNPSTDPTDAQAVASFFTDFYSILYCSTGTFRCYRGVEGLTRSPSAGSGFYGSWTMSYSVSTRPPRSINSEIYTDRVTTAFVPGDGGVWLYRAEVPMPATLWLCGAGLAALGINRRQRQHFR